MRYKQINKFNRAISFFKELFERPHPFQFLIYRFKWNYYPVLNIVPRFPLHIDIEVTDACNLKCIMCVHGSDNIVDTGFMDYDFCKDMIRQAAIEGAFSIKLNWRGEPALCKDLPELISFAKHVGIQEVQINTNGLPFSEKTIRKHISSGLDRIIFSVDGNTRETYDTIRKGGNFERLIRNIESFIRIRRELGRVKPFIRVQMVRMKQNRYEVDGFLKRWSNFADDVRISDVTDRGQGTSLRVGDQVSIGRRKCPQPWLRMVINREGKVLPCCSDWYCKWEIGDATKEPLKSIWNGEQMNRLRKRISEGKLDEFEPCRSCFVKESYNWKKVE